MNSIKVCEYPRSRSFHDDLILQDQALLQDQASGERSQDHWSSGCDVLEDGSSYKYMYMYLYFIFVNGL